MKKAILATLILSLLLAALNACGAEAQQPATPEPAPKVEQSEPEKPELPPESTPEPQTDVEPETKPEPVADAEPEPENTLEFTDCNETVYATSQVNLRAGPGTSYDKVGSLSTGNSTVRTGIDYNSCDGWSRIQLSDGNIVYVSSNYISTAKPAAQTPSSTQSSMDNQNNNNGQSSVNSDLANSGLDFSGPNNIITPGAGKTQEQLDKEFQEMLERTKDEHFQ